MKSSVFLLSFVFVLPACGGALDPILLAGDVGGDDGGIQDGGDLRPDMPPVSLWRQVPAPTPSHLEDVWGRSTSEVFAVGRGGVILELEGGAWVEVASGTTEDLYAVWGLPSGEVYAGGDAATVLQRTATGWTPLPSPFNETLGGFPVHDLWASSPTQILVVSREKNVVQHFDGTAWIPHSTMAPRLHAVWGSSPTRIFTAGLLTTSTELRTYRFDGTQWNLMAASGPLSDVNALWGDESGAVVGVGPDTFLFLEDEDTWLADREGGLGQVFGVWGLSPSQLFVVGAEGGLHFWNGKNLQTWPAYTTATLRSVWASALTDVWAVGDEGVILRYGP